MSRSLFALQVFGLWLLTISNTFALQGPTIRPGNLSVGKFYTVSLTPNSAYPDSFPNEWTSGAELTDETYGGSIDSAYVGWWGQGQYSFDIVLDLGKSNVMRLAKANCASQTDWGIYFPQSITVSTRNTTSEDWTTFGTMNTQSNTKNRTSAWLACSGSDRVARYVKFTVLSSGDHVFISEIQVYGDIVNSWRNVPDYGCYHGAYPVDATGNLTISAFETLIGKPISIVLWYENMDDAGFASYLGGLWWNSSGWGQYGVLMQGLNYTGARYLEIGWEPKAYVTAAQIAQGCYDTYFKQWFTESITYSNRHNNTDPVWLRPMSEMNGSWTFAGNVAAWGGDPLNYRRAWRRMYNVAEQVGAADKHIFDFSPNGVSYPSDSWNQPAEYYPGDQYVDWIGISVYPQGSYPTPSSIIEPFYTQWPYKPMLISEGGYKTGITVVDGLTWIEEWFDAPLDYPTLKALVWFGGGDYALSNQDASVVAAYKARASSSFYLRQSIAGRFDFNKDSALNLFDTAVLSKNWRKTGANYQGDINGDNNVNLYDLAIMSEHWLE